MQQQNQLQVAKIIYGQLKKEVKHLVPHVWHLLMTDLQKCINIVIPWIWKKKDIQQSVE